MRYEWNDLRDWWLLPYPPHSQYDDIQILKPCPNPSTGYRPTSKAPRRAAQSFTSRRDRRSAHQQRPSRHPPAAPAFPRRACSLISPSAVAVSDQLADGFDFAACVPWLELLRWSRKLGKLTGAQAAATRPFTGADQCHYLRPSRDQALSPCKSDRWRIFFFTVIELLAHITANQPKRR